MVSIYMYIVSVDNYFMLHTMYTYTCIHVHVHVHVRKCPDVAYVICNTVYYNYNLLYKWYSFLKSIDINSEEVLLQNSLESVGPNDLSAHISDTNPRYDFYLYKHTHEGDYMESIGKNYM